MEYVTEQKYLTWDPAYPVPFESLWSIIVKVIVINNITLAELATLIKRDEVTVSPAIAVDCANTDWIDFAKFSRLLGIDVRRLTGGTWDQMEMEPLYKRRYAIRRCPECWKLGYHCVLFDLDIVAVCPWHRCHLTRHCASCAFSNTFAVRTRLPLINKRFCAGCELVLPDRQTLLSQKRISANVAAMITGYCVELVDWWRRVGLNFPDRDRMLSGLLCVDDSERGNTSYRGWQLYQAYKAVQGLELFWQFRIVPEPSRYTVVLASYVPDDLEEARRIDREHRIHEVAGKCYRSLRRHLYTKFVRPHRHCYQRLKALGREECLALNADHVCVVSWAFLVWRMSIEGVCYVEGLRLPRRDNFALRLTGPRNYRLPISEGLRWCYFAFFGIWRELEVLCGTTTNIRVEIATDDYEGHFEWKPAAIPAEASALQDGATVRLNVLYPDLSDLTEDARWECRQQRIFGNEIVDQRRVNSDSSWAWARDTRSLRDCLFIARHPDNPAAGKQFWHICV